MRPEKTVFVAYDKTERQPVVFTWDEGLEVFCPDARWTVVSGPHAGAHEIPQQPFIIEGWFGQPTAVRGLSGEWWLVQDVGQAQGSGDAHHTA